RRAQLALPSDRTGLEVDVEDHPAMGRGRLHASGLRCGIGDPFLGRWLGTAADGRRHEDVIDTDRRRHPALTTECDLPRHVFSFAPRLRKRRVIVCDAGLQTAELW